MKVAHHLIINNPVVVSSGGNYYLKLTRLRPACDHWCAVCRVKLTSKQSNIIASQTRDGGSDLLVAGTEDLKLGQRKE